MKSTGALIAPTVAFLVLLWMIPWVAAWAAPHVQDDFAKIVIEEALSDFGNSYRIIVGLALVVVMILGLLGRIGLPSKTVGVMFASNFCAVLRSFAKARLKPLKPSFAVSVLLSAILIFPHACQYGQKGRTINLK